MRGRLHYINPITTSTYGVFDGVWWTSGTFLPVDMVSASYRAVLACGYPAFIEWE